MSSFIRYYKRLLVESPDEVYTNDGKWLNPGDTDSRTFGWFAYLKDIKPFLLCSSKRSTHHDLYHDFFNHLRKTISAKEIPTAPKNMLVPNLSAVVKELKNSKHWPSILNGKLLQEIDAPETIDPSLPYSIQTEIESKYRTKVFNNSGRLWTKNGVISFWNKQGEVPAERITEVLSLFGKTPENFYIDIVNTQNIKDEELSTKTLPTVKEYLSKSYTPTKLSKEEETKYKELLAKKHTATDPIERKKLQDLTLGNTEKNWGSTKIAKDTPLSLRQKAFTSESKK